MFTISKKTILAEVVITAGYLQLVQLNPDFRFNKAHTAILNSLKVLGQMQLGKTKTYHADAVLAHYFEAHGWNVQMG